MRKILFAVLVIAGITLAQSKPDSTIYKYLLSEQKKQIDLITEYESQQLIKEYYQQVAILRKLSLQLKEEAQKLNTDTTKVREKK